MLPLLPYCGGRRSTTTILLGRCSLRRCRKRCGWERLPRSTRGGGAAASAHEEPSGIAGNGVSAVALDEALPNWRDAARSLAVRGWVLSAEVALAGDHARFGVRTPGPELRDEQRVAVEAVGAAL